MSIHPKYAEAILCGVKLVEFRKRALAPDIDRVVIYATSPIKRVVGEFIIDETVRASPSRLWETLQSVGGIRRKDYRAYYSGSRLAVGIKIQSARRYAEPVSLVELSANPVPPQSFCYLDDKGYEELLQLAGEGPQVIGVSECPRVVRKEQLAIPYLEYSEWITNPALQPAVV